MSAPAAADASAAKPKGKKMILVLVLVVLLAVGAGAWLFLGRSQGGEEDEEAAAPPPHTSAKEGVAPTYLPLESMVVNLADPGGERFAQIGVTVETDDQKTADRVKAHLPTIRNAVLMLVSQRTSEELLSKEGKEKLAAEIHREVSQPLGYDVEDGGAEDGKARKKGRRAGYNPIRGVLFSNFIIQ